MEGQLKSPSVHDVAAIIALEEQPVLRNLRITQCYYSLSCALAQIVSPINVNWCTFATWASKTAGRFIRNEEVPRVFLTMLREAKQLATLARSLDKELRSFQLSFDLFHFAEETIADVSRHITTGNVQVFAELGPLFAKFWERIAAATQYEEATLARLLDDLQLTPGATEEGKQGLLREAVAQFYAAKFETDPNRQAELVLLANAQTGLHEQIRLQPSIAGSLNLPFAQGFTQLRDRLLQRIDSDDRRRRFLLISDLFLRPLFRDLEKELNAVWRECATRFFMELRLPDGTIHLGRDVQPLPGQPLFPAPLQTITNDDLQKLLTFYHAEGDSARGSAAEDWADIPERMQFILTLFRSRQQEGQLFAQPFTSAQEADIVAGRIPSGPL